MKEGDFDFEEARREIARVADLIGAARREIAEARLTASTEATKADCEAIHAAVRSRENETKLAEIPKDWMAC